MKNLDFITLIPHHDNVEGLKRSILSIVYAPENCAILVVDDGSANIPVPSELQALTPIPVVLLKLDSNQGITAALNYGLAWILENQPNVKYITRLDCGDESSPERFYKQVTYLNAHPDIAIIGTWCFFKDVVTGQSYKYKTPLTHRRIKMAMYFRNVFIHPTVMWRTAVMQQTGVYPFDFPHAEDYGFFYKILGKYKAAILPDFLVTCEITKKGISLKYRQEQFRSRIKVIRQFGASKILTFAGTTKLLLLASISPNISLIIKNKIFR